jgi:hypothetical protein
LNDRVTFFVGEPHYQVAREFLESPERCFRHLFAPDHHDDG